MGVVWIRCVKLELRSTTTQKSELLVLLTLRNIGRNTVGFGTAKNPDGSTTDYITQAG